MCRQCDHHNNGDLTNRNVLGNHVIRLPLPAHHTMLEKEWTVLHKRRDRVRCAKNQRTDTVILCFPTVEQTLVEVCVTNAKEAIGSKKNYKWKSAKPTDV